MSTRIAAVRTRWAAVGAAVAVTIGAAGISGYNLVSADIAEGDRPVFVPTEPCRLTDTRPDPNNVGGRKAPIAATETMTIRAHGSNGECTGESTIPADAVALSLNVTALNATSQTFLTFWGEGENPGTANLNPAPGQPPTPNAVNTPLSSAGTFNVYNDSGNVDVVIDVNGFYANHNHDDRYSTKAEVDAAIEASSTMWARVEPDGTIVDSSPGVTGEEYDLATGRVVVRFPRDVSTCAYSVAVTQDLPGDISTIAVSGVDIGVPIGGDAVYLYVRRNGTEQDTELSLTVNC